MADNYPEQYPANQYVTDMNIRLRDIEEKQRLIKDRLLLIGKSVIEEREKIFDEMQEAKKTLLKIEEENKQLKEILRNLAEQLGKTARKEELMILQRQFDMFRKE